jgi:hypothetical protein
VRAGAALAAAGLLALPALAAAAPHVLPAPQVDPGAGVTFALSTCVWEPPPSGMLALRVTVENAVGRARTWSVRFEGRGSYGEAAVFGSTETIEVPAGGTRVLELMVPMSGTAEADSGFSNVISAAFRGPGLSGRPVGLVTSHQYLNTSAGERALTQWVGLSESLAVAAWEPAKAELGRGGTVLVGSRFDPGCLSSDWRSYLGFRALALTADEWRDLDAGARGGIERWVAGGGRLWIAGAAGPARRLGAGRIEALPDRRDLTGVALAAAVFGRRRYPTITRPGASRRRSVRPSCRRG